VRTLRQSVVFGERGAKHVAIFFSSRSLLLAAVSLFTLPPLPRTLTNLPEADHTSAPHRSPLSPSPTPPRFKKPRHQVPIAASAAILHTFTAIDLSKLTGTIWSRREPTARWNSPAHPRSWQAPFPCPRRARKRQALYSHCTYFITLE
jgi:hypothetical protein